MIRAAYYNEHDPFAAAWLRELIRDNLIAPGEVDERSIEDVTPDELRPFRQCHFFAGIGVWSLAARLAGIPDDAPLWSGSCPCQPFSAAGKGGGFDDERHLWPAFHYLIEQCGPALIVGEQVAGVDGDAWLDLVSADLDATGYAFGAAETCAAGFGAPHERSRNYWLAHRLGLRLEGFAGDGAHGDQPGWIGAQPARSAAASGEPLRLADHFDDGQRQHGHGLGDQEGAGEGDLSGGSQRLRADPANGGAVGGLADADGGIAGNGQLQSGREHRLIAAHRGAGGWPDSGTRAGLARRMERPGPVNGYWRDADWLRCRDEKWRPVEPGTFPLADAGTFRNRVGLLRGAGNAITIGQAEGFLRAVVESLK